MYSISVLTVKLMNYYYFFDTKVHELLIVHFFPNIYMLIPCSDYFYLFLKKFFFFFNIIEIIFIGS